VTSNDLTVQKIGLDIAISEADLVAFLLSRYPAEKIEALGVSPELSTIRSYTYQHEGRCVFQVSALTFSEAEGFFLQVENTVDDGSLGESEKNNVMSSSESADSSVEGTKASGCPRAAETLHRISKARKSRKLKKPLDDSTSTP